MNTLKSRPYCIHFNTIGRHNWTCTKVVIAFSFQLLKKPSLLILIIFSQLLHKQCNVPSKFLNKSSDIYMIKIARRKLKLLLNFPEVSKLVKCVVMPYRRDSFNCQQNTSVGYRSKVIKIQL